MGARILVSRYADVAACLRHPALSSAIASDGILRRQLDLMDPPRHTQLRQILAKAFDRSLLEQVAAVAERWIAERLAALPHRFDVIAEIAKPLPLVVVGEVLGLPPEDRGVFERGVSAFVDVVANGGPVDDASVDALRLVVGNALARTDLVAGTVLALVREASPDVIELDDVVANAVLIMAAGHQTTTNLIGNGLWLLLAHPDQRALLDRRPDGWALAIEEILRFESPVQSVRRVAAQAFVVGDRAIAAGDELALLLGTANRDPDAFADPNRFDVHRTPNRHLAFGGGAHLCLGAHVARVQAAAALKSLCALPSLRLVDREPAWAASTAYRGLERLIVEWT